MHKTKNAILIIAAVIVIGCLLYIPGMTKLGLYRDDWNNYYNALINGPDMLIQHYAADRPADGYLLSFVFRLFGTNNNAYLIYNLCCRILGSIFLALTLLVIWPRTSKMAAIAGILAVAFPGFLQQVDGIAYVPHQTAMLFFMLSLFLTAKACEPGQTSWNVLFTFLSLIFSFGNMILMEYYIGMEIYRFALIYLLNREQAGNGRAKAFFKALLSYIPYLIPAAGFVAWRTLLFSAKRAGTDVIAEVIRPFITYPWHEIPDLAMRMVKNVWKLFAGVWSLPVYNMLNGMEMKPFVYAIIPALIIAAAAQIFLFLMHRKRTDRSAAEARHEASQWLWCGLITGTIAIFPLVLAGRDINFTASLDRFAWPGMLGSILFLAGLLGSMKDRSLRNVVTFGMIVLAVFVQWQNKVDYIDIWKNTQNYWQQMIWRVPGLEEGTTIVSGAAVLAEEDYEVFAPASLIYYPYKNNRSPLGAEILREDTVRSIKLGEKTGRLVREIYIEKDYQKLLAVSKPTADSCLRVINGTDPIYSLNEWSKIPEIGSYSKPAQIITEPAAAAVYPFFLGEEQEHGWCYYYEKMELALQMEDPEAAAALADEASAKNLQAADEVELIPVIEAYLASGRTEDALSAAERLRSDDYLAFNAGNYFSAKENAADFDVIIRFLNGETVMPDVSEMDEPTETDAAQNPAETSEPDGAETELPAAEPAETETVSENTEEPADETPEETSASDYAGTVEPAEEPEEAGAPVESAEDAADETSEAASAPETAEADDTAAEPENAGTVPVSTEDPADESAGVETGSDESIVIFLSDRTKSEPVEANGETADGN